MAALLTGDILAARVVHEQTVALGASAEQWAALDFALRVGDQLTVEEGAHHCTHVVGTVALTGPWRTVPGREAGPADEGAGGADEALSHWTGLALCALDEAQDRGASQALRNRDSEVS